MKLNIASLLSLFVIPSVWATGGVDQGKCTGCQVFEGKIDYKVIGNSMSYSEDRTNCYKKSSSSAHLSVPSGAKIEKAYLYWSGSGGLDNSVKLNGQTVYAQQTFVDTMHIWNDPNGKFYGAYADVTHKVSGSGTYKVTGLTFSNAYAYCQSNAAYGAWVLSVVYSDSSLADDTRIHVCQDNFEFTFPEGTYSESIDCVKPSGNCAREAELTLATFESDDYKGEHFYIQGKYKGDNLFNGQTAPNLDIAEFAIPEGDITGSTHSVSYTFNTYLVYSEFGWAIEGLYAAVAILKYTGEDCGVCPAPKVYDDCGSACPPTCTDPNPSCGGGCVKDCFCPDGLVLDEETDECVLYTDCKHNGGGGGDPHISRWNQEPLSFHGECDLVMIHSDEFHEDGLDLHIRTTIEEWYSYIEAAALRLGEYVLQVEQDGLTINKKHYSFGEIRDLPEPMRLGDAEEGYFYDIEVLELDEDQTKIRVQLQEHSEIFFTFYKQFLHILVSGNTVHFADSVGLLGEFGSGAMRARDGHVIGNMEEFAFDWQVNPEKDIQLFPVAREPQLPKEKCRMPTEPAPSRRNLRSDKVMYNKAVEACSHKSGARFELCVEDVVATGEVGLATAW